MTRFSRENPRFFVVIGLFLMVIANFLRWGLHPGAHLSANTLDGILGFAYGVSIGVMLMGIIRLSRQRKSGTCG